MLHTIIFVMQFVISNALQFVSNLPSTATNLTLSLHISLTSSSLSPSAGCSGSSELPDTTDFARHQPHHPVLQHRQLSGHPSVPQRDEHAVSVLQQPPEQQQHCCHGSVSTAHHYHQFWMRYHHDMVSWTGYMMMLCCTIVVPCDVLS